MNDTTNPPGERSGSPRPQDREYYHRKSERDNETDRTARKHEINESADETTAADSPPQWDPGEKKAPVTNKKSSHQSVPWQNWIQKGSNKSSKQEESNIWINNSEILHKRTNWKTTRKTHFKTVYPSPPKCDPTTYQNSSHLAAYLTYQRAVYKTCQKAVYTTCKRVAQPTCHWAP